MSAHDPLSDFVDNCCGDPNCTNDCERTPLIPRPAHGVSPCFVNCGKPACQKLGCVRVYNADNGWMGEWNTLERPRCDAPVMTPTPKRSGLRLSMRAKPSSSKRRYARQTTPWPQQANKTPGRSRMQWSWPPKSSPPIDMCRHSWQRRFAPSGAVSRRLGWFQQGNNHPCTATLRSRRWR